MSRTFNYQSATVEEIAEHLLTVQNQAYSRTLNYYKIKEDVLMVCKLEQAKILSKINKLKKEYSTNYE